MFVLSFSLHYNFTDADQKRKRKSNLLKRVEVEIVDFVVKNKEKRSKDDQTMCIKTQLNLTVGLKKLLNPAKWKQKI